MSESDTNILEQYQRDRCRHGWRGSVPEDGKSIADRCPSCGQKSLFIGKGGWLTCANLSCKDPATGRAIVALGEKVLSAGRLLKLIEDSMPVAQYKNGDNPVTRWLQANQ